ncbi:hypothetical protein [Streptomyces sp. NPDC053560]
MCPTCNNSRLVPQPNNPNELTVCPDCDGNGNGGSLPFDEYHPDVESTR